MQTSGRMYCQGGGGRHKTGLCGGNLSETSTPPPHKEVGKDTVEEEQVSQ